MPRRYRKRPDRRFRRFKKRFGKRFATRHPRTRKAEHTMVNYGSRIVPDSMYAKLRYQGGFTVIIDSITGAGSSAFRGNSMFDPDATGVGNQPIGFDEYAVFYSRYRVIGSSIKVTAVSQNSASDEQVVLVLVPQKAEDVGGGIWPDRMDPYAKKMLVPSVQQGYAKSLKQYMSTAKMMGMTKTAVEDRDFGPFVTASPLTPQQWFWNVVCDTYNSITPTADISVSIVVEITYYAKFFERKNLSVS